VRTFALEIRLHRHEFLLGVHVHSLVVLPLFVGLELGLVACLLVVSQVIPDALLFEVLGCEYKVYYQD
jgi:hypothetical protein